MTLKRFLVTSSLKHKSSVSLTPEETHHLKDVLRIKEGAKCLLFDREGNEFVAEVRAFKNNGSTEVHLLEPVSANAEKLKLSVAQAIPQDRKMDDIVRKSAELGIYELIPLVTKRTIVRISKGQFEKVSARWQRILEQGAKQSRISKLTRLSEPVSFEALCERFSQYDKAFILHPSKEATPIRESLKTNQENVLLMIGPEGGFSEDELELAKERGALLVRMGSEIMRTDTAFVAAASFLKLMSEE